MIDDVHLVITPATHDHHMVIGNAHFTPAQHDGVWLWCGNDRWRCYCPPTETPLIRKSLRDDIDALDYRTRAMFGEYFEDAFPSGERYADGPLSDDDPGIDDLPADWMPIT